MGGRTEVRLVEMRTDLPGEGLRRNGPAPRARRCPRRQGLHRKGNGRAAPAQRKCRRNGAAFFLATADSSAAAPYPEQSASPLRSYARSTAHRVDSCPARALWARQVFVLAVWLAPGRPAPDESDRLQPAARAWRDRPAGCGACLFSSARSIRRPRLVLCQAAHAPAGTARVRAALHRARPAVRERGHETAVVVVVVVVVDYLTLFLLLGWRQRHPCRDRLPGLRCRQRHPWAAGRHPRLSAG